MAKLTICRICLVENVRMHVVANSRLQEIYEKLTNIPFITEDSRPMLACFFCYARLKQCYKFWQKCVEAEAVFMQMLDEEYEKKPMQAELEFFGGFLKTSIIHISIEAVGQQEDDEREYKEDIEEELTSDCETTDNVEIKEEYHSDAAEEETIDDSNPGFEDNPHIQSESEDDIPLTRMKTGLEQAKTKRKVTTEEGETREKSVPAAKKPKLDIRKENLEDTISTKDKKIDKANSKVIDRTKNSKIKFVSKIIQPIKSKPIKKRVNEKRIIISENAAICTNISNKINNHDLQCKCRGINSEDIKNHVLNHGHLSKDDNNCDVFQSNFYHKGDLKIHTGIHTGDKPYKCDICQRSFTHKCSLERHIRVHTGERLFKCDICQISFTRKSHLVSHIREHTGDSPYKCETCLRTFTFQADLDAHIRVHTGKKPYECDICQRRFTQRRFLVGHIRIHSGDRPFKCNICKSSFTRKSHLERHIRLHSGEKPYKCEKCKRSLTRKSHLERHILLHSGEKPYKCDKCKSSYTQKSHLRRHIRVHTGERPYKCEICQRSFSFQDTLNRHILTHTGEKPYKCDLCKSSFTRNSDLDRHIRLHTGERLF